MAKLPNSITDWNDWTDWNHWDVAHNFTDATGSPVTCAAVTGSVAFGLSRLGTTDPALLSAPQAQMSTQGGIQVRTAQELLYRGADANWSVDSGVVTVYAVLFKLETNASGAAQDIFCGQDGTGGGWAIQVDASNFLRLRMMGSTSGNVLNSGQCIDGRWHLALVVIDDAGNRGKLVTEWGDASLTGIAYSESGPLICTIGPTFTAATFPKPVSYAVCAKGKHHTGWTEATNILNYFREYYIREAEEGLDGADNESTDAQESGTVDAVQINGGMNSFESDWYENVFDFTGSPTLDAPASAGTFAVSAIPVDFTYNVVLDAPTSQGVIVKSAWARQRHVDKAVSRVVRQLLGNYNPASFEAIAQNVELAAPESAGEFGIGP